MCGSRRSRGKRGRSRCKPAPRSESSGTCRGPRARRCTRPHWRAVQFLKGKSSHKLLSEFPSLRKRYWGQHLWARGYWVASSGNVTDEAWKKYIETQQPEPPDDNFKVV